MTINIKNLYFGGMNGFFEPVDDDNPTEMSCDDHDPAKEIEAVQVDPDTMAKVVASLTHLDLVTVQKVFAGADRFLKEVANHE